MSAKLKETTTLQLAKMHVARAKVYLSPDSSWLKYPAGKNFKNGFFVFSEGKLYPHSHKRWETSVSEINYDPEATFSLESQKFLIESLGSNRHYINAIRSAGFRSMVVSPELQTGYYLYGPPGSGKSTIISLLMFITESCSKSCELNDLDNAFSRHEIMESNLLVINEFVKIDKKYEKFIKSFLGRDYISSEVKNKQGYDSKIFNGIIMITSNLGPDITFGQSQAMNDRFIPIEYSPRKVLADPNLLNKLKLDISAWINWHLSINKDIIKTITRATLINKESSFENSIMAQYITERLCFKTNGMILVKEFKENYNSYLLERGFENNKYTTDTTVELVSLSQSLFNKEIMKTRPMFKDDKKRFVFKGVCLRTGDDEIPLFKHESFEMNHDIWENFRTNSKQELIEIVPFDSKDSLQLEVPTKENRGLKEMTEDGHNKCSHVGNVFPNPLIVSTTVPKRKSVLIFTMNKGVQYPLNQKPPKLKVTKHTLTNLTESTKYLGQPIPKHDKVFLNEVFEDSISLLKQEIIDPLSQMHFESDFVYHPHKPFPHYNLVRRRIACCMKLGLVADSYATRLGSNEVIWFETLNIAQTKNPPIGKENAKRHNLFQTKNHFTGKLLPNEYFWDDCGSPRFVCKPSHTIRDVHKEWRFEMFKALSSLGQVYLYDCDLSSCHARVVMLFRTKLEAPLLYKSFQEEDLYLDIALSIKKRYTILNNLDTKVLRKIVKIKSLAMLNGGGLQTADHITDLLLSQYPPESTEFTNMVGALTSILKEEPIVKEFNQHGRYIYSKHGVFLLSHGSLVKSTNSPHILNSPVMCCVETLVMTYLIEFIGSSQYKLLPVTTIHDGVLVASRNKINDSELKTLNFKFMEFIDQKLGIKLPIEFTDVGIDL